MYPLVQGVSSWEWSSPASDASEPIGGVPIGNVVAVQHHILIKFDEEGINNLLSLEDRYKIRGHEFDKEREQGADVYKLVPRKLPFFSMKLFYIPENTSTMNLADRKSLNDVGICILIKNSICDGCHYLLKFKLFWRHFHTYPIFRDLVSSPVCQVVRVQQLIEPAH